MKRVVFIFIFFAIYIAAYAESTKILRFKHLTTDNGLPNNAVYSIIQDKYGFIWFGTLDGLCRYDGYEVKIYKGNAKIADLPINNRPIAMANDSLGNLYIAFSFSDHQVCRYNFEADNFTRIPFSKLPSQVMQALKTESQNSNQTIENNGYIWDIKSKKLVQKNKKDGRIYTYQTDPGNNWSISDDIVLSAYLDNQNVLWVGTDNGGISYADLNQPSFRFFSFHTEKNKYVKESIIRAIYQDNKNNLWIGTRSDGLVKMSPNGKTQLIYRTDPKNKNSIGSNCIRKIYADSHGYIWIGTKNGLDKLNPQTNRFEHYSFNQKDNSPIYVFSVFEDSEGILWAGTWRGLARYDRQLNRFIPYFSSTGKTLLRIRDIIEDKKGNLWIATQMNGLVCLHKTKQNGQLCLTTQRYVNIPNNQNSIGDDWLYCLSMDASGKIWIGSGAGLNRFDPVTNTFTRFKDHSSIDELAIHGILYSNGYIWASHQDGLTRINCKTLNSRNFSKKYDFFGNEFSEDAFYKNENTGELFFGGNKGFISFNPTTISDQHINPNVLCSALRISGKKVRNNQTINGDKVLDKPLYLTKNLQLSWKNHNIQIQFAGMYFPSPELIKYAYRLKGFDDSWMYADFSTRTAVYSNLPDGKYTFEVKATRPDGRWSDNLTTINITVLTPWWRSWWAYSIYAGFFIALLLLIIKFILNRQKYMHDIRIERLNAERIKEIDELKTSMFTNISHEFRTPLTLIIGPIEKLVQNTSFDEQSSYYHRLISKNAHRLMELINQFLDLRKIEEGKLRLNCTTSDFILYVRSLAEYFELHASLNNIDFSITTDCEHQMAVFDTEKMDKILLNLLMNAFKNTQNGGSIRIEIQCAMQHEIMTIRICDTGYGIPANDLNKIFEPFFQTQPFAPSFGTGIGLTMVRELIQLHGGSIEVQSTVDVGTCFTIKLPILNTVSAYEERQSKSGTSMPSMQTPDVNPSQTPQEEMHTSTLNILLVEDNSEVRNYLSGELSDIANITQSANGKEAIGQAKSIIPDLIISDVMMPEMDGFEFCRIIKNSEITSHIPVILLTAQQSDEFKISGYETGADAYITKPFSTTVLKARIRNLLEIRRKLRLLFDKTTDYNTGFIATNPVDKVFLQKIEKIILDNLNNSSLDVEELASKINLSRTQLYRKIKALTDKSALEFITTIKLRKATELMLSGEYSITQISDMIGASDVSNFSRMFTRQYGLSPSAYRKKIIR